MLRFADNITVMAQRKRNSKFNMPKIWIIDYENLYENKSMGNTDTDM